MTTTAQGRVLVLVHVPDPDLGRREVGSLLPALLAAGLDVEIASATRPGPLPDPAGLRALVVMGSEEAAYDDDVPWLAAELAHLRAAVDAGTPVLGVCFGGQALARVLGGVVARAAAPERGFTTIGTAAPDAVPAGPWMEFHGDAFTTPPGAVELARTDAAVQAFAAEVGGVRHLGLQFHPEITVSAFDAWVETWVATGELARLEAAGVDVPALRREVEQRADASAVACAALLGDFLRSSGR